MVPISLAKQEKSPQKRALAAYADLEPESIRVTLHVRSGMETLEIYSPYDANGVKSDKMGWLSQPEAESALNIVSRKLAEERLAKRLAVRLPDLGGGVSYDSLKPEDQRVLRMSNKEWNSYSLKNRPPNPGIPPSGEENKEESF
jgi:hypothetical protein